MTVEEGDIHCPSAVMAIGGNCFYSVSVGDPVRPLVIAIGAALGVCLQ